VQESVLFSVLLRSLLLASLLMINPSIGQAATSDDALPTLSFHTLSSFKCDETFKGPDGRLIVIPQALQRLSGRKVAVEGFVVPLQLSKDGTVTSFALCRDRNYCCYGVTPTINEVILCDLRPGQHCRVQKDTPTRVCGTLEVSAKFTQGELLSIYRMQVDSTSDIMPR
jgi:hypothetical protein